MTLNTVIQSLINQGFRKAIKLEEGG